MLIRFVLWFVIATFSLTGCAGARLAQAQTDFSSSGAAPANDMAPQQEDDFLDTEYGQVFDDDWDADFDDWDASPNLIADPFEPVNRGFFWVNDKLYFYLFKPVARGYGVVVPRPARVSVSNFF